MHVEGEAEYPMMLPPSLPSSPDIDLETDIANGLEELRLRASMQPTSPDPQTPTLMKSPSRT